MTDPDSTNDGSVNVDVGETHPDVAVEDSEEMHWAAFFNVKECHLTISSSLKDLGKAMRSDCSNETKSPIPSLRSTVKTLASCTQLFHDPTDPTWAGGMYVGPIRA